MRQIVLASKSPRRKELLKSLGLKFETDSANYKEDKKSRSPKETAILHAKEKAKEVAKKHKNAIVLGFDTIGTYRNRIIGKPKDKKDAKEILRFLNGSRHRVITGICIIDTNTGKTKIAAAETYIKFTNMTDEEMDAYICSGEGNDKACGFAIQGKGALFIEKIEGEYFNVVGLPIFKLSQMLKEFGINLIKC